MRALNILCGLGVLFSTLGYGHLIYHFLTHTHPGETTSPVFWAGAAFAVVAGVFSFIGGGLLLRRAR